MRRRFLWVGVIAAALLPALAGCSAAPSPAPLDGVRFEVMQGRTDYTSGTLVLRVINGGPSAVTLTRSDLTWAGFSDAAEWSATTLDAGRTVDLRTDVPALDCDAASTAAPTLSVRTSGSSRAVTVTPDDPLATLPRLHDTGCVTVRLNRIAAIDLAGPLGLEGSGDDAVAVLSLRLTPTGADGTVQLTGVGSTPLLAPADGAERWPLSLTVEATSAVQTVDLRIRPARCDSHALAEDKIGTVLVLSVRIDGIDGVSRFPVDDSTRQALYAFVKSVCGMP
ncbi:hypothetical protein L1277_000475 [Okibacterium sp. HSC-33S16]|uniref:hypothetical protein n=1 Tax=Okibacterium sp. HSC-33S16 TaxID=2910965 RepID=UPI00209E37CB|nr:hypothetical protein [Okibacterium sp. HSC-33S16]MCP2030411.1 hypothetical protein [Okibacterium sp. HSC-33S16]